MSSVDSYAQAAQLDAAATSNFEAAHAIGLQLLAADSIIAGLTTVLHRGQAMLASLKRLNPDPLVGSASDVKFWQGPIQDHFVPTAKALNQEFYDGVRLLEQAVRTLQMEIDDAKANRGRLQARHDEFQRAGVAASQQASAMRSSAAAQASAEAEVAAQAAREVAAQAALGEAAAKAAAASALVSPGKTVASALETQSGSFT